jgi:deoxyribonuclease-4
MVLLEGTAGQGRSLGSSFEQLAEMLDRLGGAERVGFCLDTCHLFAAGYDLASPGGYERTLRRFDDLIGLSRLRVVHLNDSTRPLGSRVDRHTHIGRGTLGRETFRRLLGDDRLRHLPMILETPKTEGRSATWVGRDALDQRNLAVLRRLSAPADRAAAPTAQAPRRTPRPRT